MVLGWLDELWASPRLLPYNLLRLMMAAAYAPALRAVLDERARRARGVGPGAAGQRRDASKVASTAQ